jgi:hypothetical protein
LASITKIDELLTFFFLAAFIALEKGRPHHQNTYLKFREKNINNVLSDVYVCTFSVDVCQTRERGRERSLGVVRFYISIINLLTIYTKEKSHKIDRADYGGKNKKQDVWPP